MIFLVNIFFHFFGVTETAIFVRSSHRRGLARLMGLVRLMGLARLMGLVRLMGLPS